MNEIINYIQNNELQIQILSIIFVLIVVEILKYMFKTNKYIKKYTKNKLKMLIFIISLLITTIPVVFLFQYNSISEFIGVYTQFYLQVEGVYNVLKNLFRYSMFKNENNDINNNINNEDNNINENN